MVDIKEVMGVNMVNIMMEVLFLLLEDILKGKSLMLILFNYVIEFLVIVIC